MTALDLAYARRLSRAIEVALVAEFGREGYERLLAEGRRRDTAGARLHDGGSVVAGGLERRELGGIPHEDDRDAD